MVDNRGPKIASVMWVVTALAIFFVALRVYCKTRFNRTLGWDDHVVTVALVIISPLHYPLVGELIFPDVAYFVYVFNIGGGLEWPRTAYY